MKFLVLIFVSLFFLGGCESASPKPNKSIARVVDDDCGNNTIIIRDIKGMTKSNGFMMAQVTGENLTNKYKLLEYKVEWFDDDGFIINSILSNWTDMPAYAAQEFHIKVIAPSAKAKTFKFYIRRDKEVICEKNYNG